MAARSEEIGRSESLSLLGAVSLGRIVYTHKALPAISPAEHLVDGDDVLIHHEHGTRISPVAVVSYEADDIDSETWAGWSVSVTGFAEVLTPEQVDNYRSRFPIWIGGGDEVVRISGGLVRGIRLIPRRPSRHRMAHL